VEGTDGFAQCATGVELLEGLFLIKQAGIVHAGGGWTCYLI